LAITAPASSPSNGLPTFVVAGIPEVRVLDSNPAIVAKDNLSLNGLRQKTIFILETIEGLLTTMGAAWSDLSAFEQSDLVAFLDAL
jgi:hypothetical protein